MCASVEMRRLDISSRRIRSICGLGACISPGKVVCGDKVMGTRNVAAKLGTMSISKEGERFVWIE